MLEEVAFFNFFIPLKPLRFFGLNHTLGKRFFDFFSFVFCFVGFIITTTEVKLKFNLNADGIAHIIRLYLESDCLS